MQKNGRQKSHAWAPLNDLNIIIFNYYFAFVCLLEILGNIYLIAKKCHLTLALIKHWVFEGEPILVALLVTLSL
jgi:hypothetical protein